MSVLTAPAAARRFDPLLDKSYRDTALGPDVVDFLNWKRLGGLAERSEANYEWALARLAKAYPDVGAAEMGDREILRVLGTYPPRGRRQPAVAFAQFFKWARLTRRIGENPMELLPSIKKPAQKVIDTFTDAEREALVSLPVRDGALMRLMLAVGLRKGEARRLLDRDILPEPFPGQVRILASKGGKDRLVPIGERTARIVAELRLLEGLEPKDHLWYVRPGGGPNVRRRFLDGGDVSESSFAGWWRRCLDDAGVRYRNPHVARHTFATNWLRRGGRLETLSEAMGHESIATTKDLYGHLDTRDIARDLALVEEAE